MGTRRLNRKVALIGSAVVLIILFAAILIIMSMGQSLEQLMNDGHLALQTARQAADEQAKEENYKLAFLKYRSAYVEAQTDAEREEVLYSLLDVCIEREDWPVMLECWDKMIKVNPKNAVARYCMLKYFYILADSGVQGTWENVHEQAEEFLQVAEEEDLLDEDTAGWKIPEMGDKDTTKWKLGPYLHLLRGRAALEMVNLGTVTNKDEYLEKAFDDFNTVRELEPDNIDAYWYLARATITKGNIYASRGSFQERDSAIEQAKLFLESAAEISDEDPKAQINLLTLKLILARSGSITELKGRVSSLEPEYQLLINTYSSSAKVYAEASQFYLICSTYLGPQTSADYLDKAIEAAQKSLTLDTQNVPYALNAANLYFRKYSIFGRQQAIDNAIEIAQNAVTWPDAQETLGPKQRMNLNNRYQLHAFLSDCYIEQIFASTVSGTSSQKKEFIESLEQTVHQIEQIIGSNEDPRVLKWQGMLELAGGNRQTAIQKLYTAYEQFKALKPPEPPWPMDLEFANLSYTLAGIFQDSSEIGIVEEFLASALHSGIDEIKPEARLDYIDVIIQFRRWSDAIQNIDNYQEYYGINERSKRLRVIAYMGAEQYDQAESELAGWAQNDPNAIKLHLELVKAKIKHTQKTIVPNMQSGNESDDIGIDTEQFTRNELKGYWRREAELVENLLVSQPDYLDTYTIVNTCMYYVANGQADRAKHIVEQYLRKYPDNRAVKVYEIVLSEPDPGKISRDRYRAIEEQVLLDITDPVRQAVQFGILYHSYGEIDKSIEYFKKATKTELIKKLDSKSETYEQARIAVNYLFEIALEKKDWKTAEDVISKAQQLNLDECTGKFYASRLAAAKGQFREALVKVDECLKQKPLFSYAYLLRSNINAALGDGHASIEDIRRAEHLNPLDSNIAKAYANVLYIRNRRLGDGVSSEQLMETKNALEKALVLNPTDVLMLSVYADYVALTDPSKALTIRENLLKSNPTVQNAVLLGRLALNLAQDEKQQVEKDKLLYIAQSAFEQARQLDPSDKDVLYYYAEYYRAIGQDEKAKELLQESQNENLLVEHYLQSGQYDKAKSELEKRYKNGSKDIGLIRGLLLIAIQSGNREEVKKYSEELVILENTRESFITQIQAYLKVGLVKEAEYKLQSFKEKYPNETGILLIESWLNMRQGRLDKALELVNMNLQYDPDNPAAWRLRGEINFYRSNYDQAISDLNKGKTILDESATRIALAKVYSRIERYEDAITELKSTLDNPDTSIEARLLLENIYIQLDRKHALKQLYEETIEKFPGNVQWLNKAAMFALQMGRFDDAEQLYKKAFLIKQELFEKEQAHDVMYIAAFDGYLNAKITAAGSPNTNNWNPAKLGEVFNECKKYENGALAPIAYLRMAQAKLLLGDQQKANEYCRLAVDKAGTNDELASEILQGMYVILGPEEVTKFCEQKLQANPDSLAANFTMFKVARINNQYDKALNYISRCIELSEPRSTYRKEFSLKKADLLALAYDYSSDNSYLRKAITEYESLLEKMPNNTDVLNNLAYFLAENDERLADALKFARRALDSQPNNPGFMDTYAYVLHKNGMNEQAAEYIEAAIQQNQQDRIGVPAELYEHKGMIKTKLGAEKEALAAYEQALKFGVDTLSNNSKRRIQEAIEHLSP